MEYECIAGHYFLSELDIVDLHEVCGVVLGIVYSGEHEEAACPGHGLDLEHTREHGLLRKWPGKKGSLAVMFFTPTM